MIIYKLENEWKKFILFNKLLKMIKAIDKMEGLITDSKYSRYFLSYQEHHSRIIYMPFNNQKEILYNNYAVRLIANKKEVCEMNFEELSVILSNDYSVSTQGLSDIYNNIEKPISHNTDSLLIMYYYPLDKYLLLDGRHRYVEYLKFNLTKPIRVKFVSSEEIRDTIMNHQGFLAYCIHYNLRSLHDSGYGNFPQKLYQIEFHN